MTETMTIDLNGCARCHGEGHPGLEFRKFTHPGDTGRGIIFTHWALCPTNGEPIFYAAVTIMPEPLKQGEVPSD
jgi:hypothetical protein